MVEYTCVKCLKKFYKKYNYNKHLERKYSCVPEDRSTLEKEPSLESQLESQKEKIKELEEKMNKLLQINEMLISTK